MRAAGVFIDSGQLSPVSAAKLVRVTAGQADVSDGAAPGGGQAPSACFLIDCPGLDTALDWAAASPPPATARSKSARPGKSPFHPPAVARHSRDPAAGTKDTIMPAYIAFLTVSVVAVPSSAGAAAALPGTRLARARAEIAGNVA